MASLDSAVASMEDLPSAGKLLDSAASVDSQLQQQTDKKLNPYIELMSKRLRATKKRVQKIEKYEHNEVSTLNADQLESLKSLSGLRYMIKELEELSKPMQQIEAEEQRQQKKAARNATMDRHALVAKKVGEANRKADERLKSYALMMGRMMTLDPDDAVVVHLKEVLCGANAVDEIKKVLECREAKLPNIDITYKQVHDALLQSDADHHQQQQQQQDSDSTDAKELLTEESATDASDATAAATAAVPAQPSFMVDSQITAGDERTPEESAQPARTTGDHNHFMAASTLSFMSGEDLINAFTTTQDKVTATAEMLQNIPFEDEPAADTPAAKEDDQSTTADNKEEAQPAAQANGKARSNQGQPRQQRERGAHRGGQGGRGGYRGNNNNNNNNGGSTSPASNSNGNNARGGNRGGRGGSSFRFSGAKQGSSSSAAQPAVAAN
ncbi:hypothetical protein RI367_006467 [Sorochytrium milnesiophthora]